MLDWGSLNQLALALAGAVYIWNPSNGETCHLMQLEGEDYVSSVRWIGQGSILAVGNSNCQVQVISRENIPLDSRVLGPYCKLGTKFYSINLWPKHEVHGP